MVQKKPKGKRWKKGDSCATNPETKTHRQMAKSRFFNTATTADTVPGN